MEDEVNRRIQMVIDAKQEWERTFDAVPDPIMLLDTDHRILRANRAMAELFGKTCQELVGRHCYEVVHGLSAPPDICPHTRLLDSMKEERSEFMEEGLGLFLDVRTTPLYREDGQLKGSLHVVRDITEHKQAEEALQESEDRYRNIFDNANEAIFVVQDSELVFINPMTTRMTGYPDNTPLPRSFAEFIHPDDRGMVSDRHVSRIKGERLPDIHSFRIIRADGKVRWVELNTIVINWGGKPATLNFMSDITERKRAEATQELNSRRTKALLQLNQMTYATLQEITDFALEEAVRLTQSQIGYLAFLNEDESVLTMHSWSKTAMAECAINRKPIVYPVETTGLWGEAVRQRQPVITNDYTATSPLKKGYPQGHVAVKRHMNVPVFEGSRIVIVAGVGNKTEEYGQDDVQQLTLLMDGMWRLLERKRAEEHLHATLESLRKAVGTTIQVISSTVEARDPYTAGRQIRSANLARVIATEMGLPPEKIEGIRMAGSIHDIGKISIPSEILTKPTRLTDLEFAMIKEHVQRGYELLKNVESPWPLAEIVHQHHEKMDGSGYPRNLKGEEILIEARILAVADVVEAMASHRPGPIVQVWALMWL
ncbi:MAG: PAS domain S-box protein [Pseudomonadota bacterium]